MAKTKWEMKMREARELRKKGAEVLFERICLLVACYDDTQFRAWHADNETDELDYLDEELSDTAASFMTLKAVLVAYPERESWVKHNIRDLIAEIIASGKTAKEPSTPKSWKSLAEELQHECERLRAEIKGLKENLAIVASAKCG